MILLSMTPLFDDYAMAILVERAEHMRFSFLGGPGFMPRQREGHLALFQAFRSLEAS